MTEEYQYIAPQDAYPMIDHAVEKIRERFERESYGMIITHDELKSLLGIVPAKTIEDAQKEQLDYLSGVDGVKSTLLEDYNLCLYRVSGIGYQILTPEEQVRVAADYYIQKSQRALSRSMSILSNVDADQLDFEVRELQMAKISRVAWIKSAFRRKKLPDAARPKMLDTKIKE